MKNTTKATAKVEITVHSTLVIKTLKTNGKDIKVINIIFAEKPCKSICDELKAHGFKWYSHQVNKPWGCYYSDEKMKYAKRYDNATIFVEEEVEVDTSAVVDKPKAKKAVKADKAKADDKPKAVKAKKAVKKAVKADTKKAVKRAGTNAKPIIEMLNKNACKITVFNPDDYKKYYNHIVKELGFKYLVGNVYEKDGKRYHLVADYAR